MRVRAAVLACLLAGFVALVGCGDEGPPPSGSRTPAVGSDDADPDYDSPPALRLLLAEGEVDAWQGSYCWQSGDAGTCVDMVGPDDTMLPDVGSPGSVEFRFPVAPTTFRATFTPRTKGCARSYEGVVTELGDGRFRVEPAGPPGRYQVDVWGSAPQGEAPGSFLWSTPVAGPAVEPSASISIVWAPHGQVEGQQFHLFVEDLPTTPETASATITATAANGESFTFDAGKADLACPSLGEVNFAEGGDGALAEQVAALGPAPFEYAVTLTVDGTTHTAAATWPDDHVEDPFNDDPAPVPLVFDPPLR